MKKSLLILAALLVSITAWAEEPTVKEITANGVTFKMVEVKGGRFNMGGTCEQFGCEDDEFPIHVVTLGDYYIGQTEVTQELWSAIMNENPSGFQGDDHPVERVTWQSCQDFVSRLTAITGIEFRLPTESEWEFAARGGLNTHYYQYSGSDNLDEVGWYGGNDGGTTHPVGLLKPNELGIYDMTGNVFEWCQDYYGDYDMMPAESPTGPESGETRVRRGGSWGGSTHGTRVSFRIYELENIRYNYIGLRLAATTIPDDNVALTSAPSISESQQPKNGKRYNVMGQPADANYKGIVIEDGAKILVK